MITLRLATASDSQFLFELHCEAETQRYARNKDSRHIPTRAEHEDWMRRSLLNPVRKLIIIEEDGVPAGMARLDGRQHWDVSIAVLPHRQGNGVGAAALALVGARYQGTPLLATVDPENERSKRLFWSAGYEQAFKLG